MREIVTITVVYCLQQNLTPTDLAYGKNHIGSLRLLEDLVRLDVQYRKESLPVRATVADFEPAVDFIEDLRTHRRIHTKGPNNTNHHFKEHGLSKVQLYSPLRQSMIAPEPKSRQIDALSLEVDQKATISLSNYIDVDNVDIAKSTHYIYPARAERSNKQKQEVEKTIVITNEPDKELKVTEYRDGKTYICEAPKISG